MNVESLEVTQEQAVLALQQEYRAGRKNFDKIDREIRRIYRAIAAGKEVISVNDAIRKGGLDVQGRPKLAIMRADQKEVICTLCHSDHVVFSNVHRSNAAEWHFEIPWPGRTYTNGSARALLPRMPPHIRPADPMSYHILWEADWTDIPRDPYLLKRIGKDAWVVVAAWDLTDIEVAVLRAHRGR